jgi:hypothetical protein
VLAENVELGGDTQRSGMGVARVHGERRGRVISAWTSPVCSLAAQSWAAQHRCPGGHGSGGVFPPRIRLPLQGTSLGLCEPPLGTSSSS